MKTWQNSQENTCDRDLFIWRMLANREKQINNGRALLQCHIKRISCFS